MYHRRGDKWDKPASPPLAIPSPERYTTTHPNVQDPFADPESWMTTDEPEVVSGNQQETSHSKNNKTKETIEELAFGAILLLALTQHDWVFAAGFAFAGKRTKLLELCRKAVNAFSWPMPTDPIMSLLLLVLPVFLFTMAFPGIVGFIVVLALILQWVCGAVTGYMVRFLLCPMAWFACTLVHKTATWVFCHRNKIAKILLVVATTALVAVAVREHFRDPCDFVSDNPYKILDLSLEASDKDIKASYRNASLQCHPDRVDASRKAVAEQGFVKIQTAHDTLMDPGIRDVFDSCGTEGLKRLQQGFDVSKACQAVLVHQTCGDIGVELLREGKNAKQACDMVRVFNQCGKVGIQLLEAGVTAQQACPWAKVYNTCGEEGLGLFGHVRPEDACAELRVVQARRSRASYHHSFSHFHHMDPMEHVWASIDPMGHLHHHHHHRHHGLGGHRGFGGLHGMPYW